VSRPKVDPVDRAVDIVLDLTVEQRNAFTVALRQIEKRMGALANPPARERRDKKPKPAPEASNG